jgi:hypothetical protein
MPSFRGGLLPSDRRKLCRAGRRTCRVASPGAPGHLLPAKWSHTSQHTSVCSRWLLTFEYAGCYGSPAVKSVRISFPPQVHLASNAALGGCIAELGRASASHGRQPPGEQAVATYVGAYVWRSTTRSNTRLTSAVIPICRYSPVKSRAQLEILDYLCGSGGDRLPRSAAEAVLGTRTAGKPAFTIPMYDTPRVVIDLTA